MIYKSETKMYVLLLNLYENYSRHVSSCFETDYNLFLLLCLH